MTALAPRDRARRAAGWPLCVAACLLLLGLLGAQPAVTRAITPTPLFVVGHPGTTPPHVELGELQAVFLKRRVMWPNGQRVLALNYPPGDPLRRAFDSAVLGWNADAAAKYWVDVRIRDGFEPPYTVPSPSVAARIVARLPGSIAYVTGEYTHGALRVLARIEGGRVLPP